ncbi:MAG: hypothetical protein KDN22_03590 [Verrucomicrobiae bacterium]|nr:hypothetical protein [Verrucomicrobiae bacterium]
MIEVSLAGRNIGVFFRLGAAAALMLCSIYSLTSARGQVSKVLQTIDVSLPPDFDPADFRAAGGDLAFFNATHPDLPRFSLSIWRSDGTVDGTWMLADEAELIDVFETSTSTFLFYEAESGGKQLALIGEDGSILVEIDKVRASINSSHSELTWTPGVDDGRLYFGLQRRGGTLWGTDGTQEGTQLLFEAPEETDGVAVLGVSQNDLIFETEKRASPRLSTLHRMDLQTHTVEVIRSDIAGRSSVTNSGLILTFVKTDAGSSELWAMSDPSGEPQRIKVLGPDAEGRFEGPIEPLKDAFLFSVRRTSGGWELWSTDGTAEGTFLVKDVEHERTGRFHGLTQVGDRVMFFASVGVGTGGVEDRLWVSDGSTAGTLVIETEGWSSEEVIGAIGSTFYFRSRGLWQSDGTAEGTRRLTRDDGRDSVTGSLIANDKLLTNIGGEFYALDAESEKLLRIRPFPSRRLSASTMADEVRAIGDATVVSGGVLFTYVELPIYRKSLLRSDGTKAGTVVFESFAYNHLTATTDAVYFGNGDKVGRMSADELVAEFLPIDSTSRVSGVRQFRDGVLVRAGEKWADLWFIPPGIGPEPVFINDFADMGISLDERIHGATIDDIFYFPAFRISGVTPLQIWSTDGTVENTELKHAFPREDATTSRLFRSASDRIFFSTTTAEGVGHIWTMLGDGSVEKMTDGNPITLQPDSELFQPSIVVNGIYYIVAIGEEIGSELWRSDGTAAGTHMVKDINPGPTGSHPREFTEFNGKFYFVAEEGESGFDIWVTDGTAAGTRRVVDFDNAQPADTEKNARLMLAPQELTPSDDYLYFSAYTAQHGREVWRMNTTEEAEMVEDLVPGTEGAYPSGLGMTGQGLAFFAADPTGAIDQVNLRVIPLEPDLSVDSLPQLLITPPDASQPLTLSVTSGLLSPYRLESSSDLAQWQEIRSFTDPDIFTIPQKFIIEDVPPPGPVFYRLRVLPVPENASR